MGKKSRERIEQVQVQQKEEVPPEEEERLRSNFKIGLVIFGATLVGFIICYIIYGAPAASPIDSSTHIINIGGIQL
jgi:hypothetical protein